MTFKQLEALYWIARLGGFSEAAAKLHATQSAISKRVQELELQFGTELFDRSHRSARLTEKGEEMFLIAKKMLDQRDMAIRQFSRPEVIERRIRLGITELTAMTWLPRLVERIQQVYPAVVIEPDVDMGLSLREKLAADQTDIVFVPDGHNDSTFIARPLARVDNAWMCKPGFLGKKKAMRLQELATHRLLTQGEMSGTGIEYARWLRSLNVQPESSLVCNNLIALLALTVSGLGVSYLPRECLREMTSAGMLEVVDVKPSLPAVKYVALCKKEQHSALFTAIIKLAQECCDFTLMFQSGIQGRKQA
ncbi:MAG: LysR family transcriptional regulator [Pseudomonadota bacterium]